MKWVLDERYGMIARGWTEQEMVPRGCILKDGIEDGCQRMDSIGRNRRWLLENGY